MAEVLVDGVAVDYSGLPAEHRETMRLYVEHGLDPGSGISAVLRAPSECHGSRERVRDWMHVMRAV